MRALVIEASGLRKTYGGAGRRRRTVAVDGLDLEVDAGSVHGLLGPDGAGKTTTLKLLLGLARLDGGQARVLGRSVPTELAAVMPRVGAMLRGPQGAGFSTSMSARRNLDLLARASGVPRARVDEVLERVGLGDRRRTRVRRYSGGMTQRLALAAALLPAADLLVLDEPTVGLDPAGAREVWQLVRELSGSGVSVLISSHVLDEVQQVCDTVTIVDHGRAIASGAVSDLVGEARTRTRVGTDAPGAALAVLRGGGYDVRMDGTDLLVEGHEHPEEISRALAAQQIYVRELSAVRPDLESVFLRLTDPAASSGVPATGEETAP